jgi:hypothetical protein
MWDALLHYLGLGSYSVHFKSLCGSSGSPSCCAPKHALKGFVFKKKPLTHRRKVSIYWEKCLEIISCKYSSGAETTARRTILNLNLLATPFRSET